MPTALTSSTSLPTARRSGSSSSVRGGRDCRAKDMGSEGPEARSCLPRPGSRPLLRPVAPTRQRRPRPSHEAAPCTERPGPIRDRIGPPPRSRICRRSAPSRARRGPRHRRGRSSPRCRPLGPEGPVSRRSKGVSRGSSRGLPTHVGFRASKAHPGDWTCSGTFSRRTAAVVCGTVSPAAPCPPYPQRRELSQTVRPGERAIAPHCRGDDGAGLTPSLARGRPGTRRPLAGTPARS
jgi:hypothetical protein